MLLSVLIVKDVTLDGETYIWGLDMNCTKKLSVLKSVFELMPLLHIVIWVWTALSLSIFFSLSNLFLPLHAMREWYSSHQEEYQPREEFKIQSKIVLRCFDFGSNSNVATAALFPSPVTQSVVEHNAVSTCLDYSRLSI